MDADRAAAQKAVQAYKTTAALQQKTASVALQLVQGAASAFSSNLNLNSGSNSQNAGSGSVNNSSDKRAASSGFSVSGQGGLLQDDYARASAAYAHVGTMTQGVGGAQSSGFGSNSGSPWSNYAAAAAAPV